VVKMLKANKHGVFVASNNDAVIGWSRAEMSGPLSAIRGRVCGRITVNVAADRPNRAIAMRSLVYRAQWWLKTQQVQDIVVEIPTSLRGLDALFNELSLKADAALLHLDIEE